MLILSKRITHVKIPVVPVLNKKKYWSILHYNKWCSETQHDAATSVLTNV